MKLEKYEPGERFIYRDDNHTIIVELVEDRSDDLNYCYDLKVVLPIRQFGFKYIKKDTFSCLKRLGSQRHRDNGWTLERISEGSKIPSV